MRHSVGKSQGASENITKAGDPIPGPPRTRSRKGVGEGEVEHLPYPYQGRVEKVV